VAEKGAAVVRNDGDSRLFVDLEPVRAISKRRDGGDDDGDHAAPCARTMSSSFKEQPRVVDRLPLSGPVQLAASTGFAWAKKPRPDATTAAAAVTKRSGSKGPGTNNNSNGGGDGARTTSAAAAGAAAAAAAPYEVEKQEMIKQWAQVADAFSASEAYNSRFRQTLDAKQLKTGKVSLSQLTTHKHCRLAVQCCLLHSFWIL
jgi:cyclin-dependent kinase 12/13